MKRSAVLAAVAVHLLLAAPRAEGQHEAPTAIAAITDEFLRSRAKSGGAAGLSLEETRARAAAASVVLAKLEALDMSALTHDEWLTAQLLTFDAQLQRDAARFFWLDSRVTPYSSPLARNLAARFAAMPVATTEDRLAYLDALYQLPEAMSAHEARLRSQLARGIVLPDAELDLVVPFVRTLVLDPASSPFALSPGRLESVPEAERERFRTAVDRAIHDALGPAVERLAAFLDGPYRARAGEAKAVTELPDGEAYYAHLIRRHTGLPLAPAEIHATGLREIARLERELDAVRIDVGFSGTLEAFRTFLKTDRRFFASDSSEFATRMMAAISRIEPKIHDYFRRTPSAPYGVLRLDPALEPSMTYGFYQVPTAGEPRGLYRFNGAHPERRTTLMSAALIYHELIPGHHFQIVLRNENAALSTYRREASYTSYVEGWGEYASDLAGEMGMYDDPYDRAGRIAMDLFLSSRLVVDTGMNALGWTRARAMAYMRDHTLESDSQIHTETLRYSTDMPGQALAYKMGSLTISEARRRAERQMGARFDLRAFHEYLLEAGPMPMSVLQAHLECFINGERHARS